VYEELRVLQFAVSAIPEIKSKKEQFTPPLHTTTFEGFFLSSVGRAIQVATSHCLSQNFSCLGIFNIMVENPNDFPGQGKHNL
jgi:prolyl-tRNA synthetase